jgi:hypothetical protein
VPAPLHCPVRDPGERVLDFVREHGGGAGGGADTAAALTHRLRGRSGVERDEPPAIMIGQRRRVEIDPEFQAALRFGNAVERRKYSIFTQALEAAVGHTKRDAEGFVEQVRGTCVQEHFSGRVDPGNAPLGVEHDQRTRHRCDQRFGGRAGRNRRQAAARESHGS